MHISRFFSFLFNRIVFRWDEDENKLYYKSESNEFHNRIKMKLSYIIMYGVLTKCSCRFAEIRKELQTEMDKLFAAWP